MKDKLNQLDDMMDDIRNLINRSEDVKTPWSFIDARIKVVEAQKLIREMKGQESK